MKPSNYEISKLAMRALYMGLLIDTAGAVVLFVTGLILKEKGMVGSIPPDKLKLLGYTVLIVALAELLVIFVLKKRLLNIKNPIFAQPKSYKKLFNQISTIYIMLYSVALTPAIYGFLFFMLGGAQDMFVLMICVTLIGYMTVRPRPAFIEKLLEPFDFDDL